MSRTWCSTSGSALIRLAAVNLGGRPARQALPASRPINAPDLPSPPAHCFPCPPSPLELAAQSETPRLHILPPDLRSAELRPGRHQWRSRSTSCKPRSSLLYFSYHARVLIRWFLVESPRSKRVPRLITTSLSWAKFPSENVIQFADRCV
jgi:hypothetical protein